LYFADFYCKSRRYILPDHFFYFYQSQLHFGFFVTLKLLFIEFFLSHKIFLLLLYKFVGVYPTKIPPSISKILVGYLAMIFDEIASSDPTRIFPADLS